MARAKGLGRRATVGPFGPVYDPTGMRRSAPRSESDLRPAGARRPTAGVVRIGRPISLAIGGPLYLNRELSWLDFNDRVLTEALDERTPLLERLRFLAIVSSNLDEFYMVRVAGLRRQIAAGIVRAGPDGLTPKAVLDRVEARVRTMTEDQRRCLEVDLLPALARHGIRITGTDQVPPADAAELEETFQREIYPILTPLAVDPAHPFPHISNLSLSLAVELRDPASGSDHFARIKVPKILPRWLRVGDSRHFVALERVIGDHLGTLFPGMEIVGWYPFRVTRYSDLDLASVEEPEDLLEMIQEEVFRRRFGEVVRLEIHEDMPRHLRALLLAEMREDHGNGRSNLPEPAVHEHGELLDLADLASLADLDVPELRSSTFAPIVPAPFIDGTRTTFDIVRDGDVMLHHPFESFSATVERFFEEAAQDPDVLAIKTTLYRTSGDTRVVQALIDAARAGKQVAVIVELKARFDEENNIAWARMLEGYGVHVSYGATRATQLKTHAKVALVVRREPDGIRRYVHIGTGNYDSRRARLYTDFGLFTCRPDVAADVSDLFNSLTGYSGGHRYRRLLVAPEHMRGELLARIDREALLAKAGHPARIFAKLNALADIDIAYALLIAARLGVQIDLLVRGICCLRPHVAGSTDTIRVRSIVGRFLEHSRLWYFANDGQPEYLIGSADWMERNLDRRVELIVPVEEPRLQRRLDALMRLWLEDDRQSWELGADGAWRRVSRSSSAPGPHNVLLRHPWAASEEE